MKTFATVDDWYAGQDEWFEEVALLRDIVLATGLVETMKWKHPCYTDRGKNIVIVSWRKDCALASLLKGALVEDPRGRLVQPGQDRSGRYMPFTNVEEIRADQAYLEELIAKAIDVERAGLRVPPLPDEIEYVEELQDRLDGDAAFRTAFEALTPGRRRAYNIFLGKAKRSATRVSRIESALPRIAAGKGPQECICGHSKYLPRCDNSHKKHGGLVNAGG